MLFLSPFSFMLINCRAPLPNLPEPSQTNPDKENLVGMLNGEGKQTKERTSSKEEVNMENGKGCQAEQAMANLLNCHPIVVILGKI